MRKGPPGPCAGRLVYVMGNSVILKGTVCDTPDPGAFRVVESGCLVCEDGRVAGVFPRVPEEYADMEIRDFGDRLIIPGLTDLHLHAPQYAFRGTGMDLELLEWLNERAFPEEMKYADPAYADAAYRIFADDLKKSATTRACIFATIHREATERLMDRLEETGLVTYVGKVNMNRNCPDALREETQEALDTVERWLEEIRGKYTRTCAIVTPRFVPSCSDSLLKGLGEIAHREGLPVQSHLSENPDEISWVKELCPWSEYYGDVYDRFGLFGGETATVMAHGVWSDAREVDRIIERGVFLAHCPESNMNLSSGIAPIRTYLDRGMRVGLGSDIAGGSSLSLFRAMRQAVQVSKLYRRLVDETSEPLSASEAFYLATKGGGTFFGQVGCFEPGWEMDAVVLDDEKFRRPEMLSVEERLESMLYLDKPPNILAKYVAGRSAF